MYSSSNISSVGSAYTNNGEDCSSSADGTLVVMVIRAKHLPNRRKLDKQSPYVIARIGTVAQKTAADFRAGQTPSWTHEMRFQISQLIANYTFLCLDFIYHLFVLYSKLYETCFWQIFLEKNHTSLQKMSNAAKQGFMNFVQNFEHTTNGGKGKENKLLSALEDNNYDSDFEPETTILKNGNDKSPLKRASPAPMPLPAIKKLKHAPLDYKDLLISHKHLYDRPPTKSVGVLDMNRLEQSSKSLQKSLSTILEQSLDYNELQYLIYSSRADSGTKIDLQDNELIDIAAKLKSLHNIGELPIIDQIVTGNIEISEENLKKIKESSPSNESIKVNLPSNPVPDIEPTGTDNTMPRLPTIKDPRLFERVFVHRSMVNGKLYLGKNDLLHTHNERLEFFGDSVLNNLVTTIIFKEFPNSSEGDLSKIRSSLVSNKTLVEYAFDYGFDKKLRTKINTDVLKSGDKKIYADVFEAYVGALAIERGMELAEVSEWLAKLYAPLINQLKVDYILEPIDKDAKSKLYALVGKDDLHPLYKTKKVGDGIKEKFIIECTLNDEFLGRGEAFNSREAGLRAAMEGLKNSAVLEKYFLARQEIERPIKLQRMEKEAARMQRLAERIERDEENLPSTPPSPIRTSIFPISIDENTPLDIEAKNKLYGILGKKIGDKPKYVVSQVNGNLFNVKLYVRDILVTSADDASKKKAMARVAQAVLENEPAMNEVCKDFRTKELSVELDKV